MARGLDGTFFEIHHHNTAEGKYWNPALDSFTAENWREKVREIAALKMEYIVVMATALYDRCYFESSVFPLADIPCADPIEAVLDEADKCGIKGFPRQRILRRLDEARGQHNLERGNRPLV